MKMKGRICISVPLQSSASAHRMENRVVWRKPCLFSFLLLALLSAQSIAAVSTPGQYQKGIIEEYGGSNYHFHSTRNDADGVRSVIGTYHLNPAAVEAQLIQIRKSGQGKISLMLWFAPFSGGAQPIPDVYDGYIVNSSGGRLSAQHEKNLRAVARWIAYVGFEQVTLRFAPIGRARPDCPNPNDCPWSSGWNEGFYQENLAFVISTREIVESELAATSVRRLYDLGAEMGGVDGYQAPQYTTTLWADYVNRFGSIDTYGFSHAIAPGAITSQILRYDVVGVRPGAYAIDVYGPSDGQRPIDQTLEYVYNELKAVGEDAKSVIIEETHFNDPITAQQIVMALDRVPLKVKYITQWPVSSEGGVKYDITPPAQYNAYGGNSLRTGSLWAHDCVLDAGVSGCTVKVAWATSNATNVKVIDAAGVQVGQASSSGTVALDNLSVPKSLRLLADGEIVGELSVRPLAAGTPRVDWLGAALACDRFQCVVATGSNLQSGCAVNLFAHDGAQYAYFGPALNPVCQGDSVRFELPQSLQESRGSVDFSVLNPNGAWSEPVSVSITRPAPKIYRAGLGCDQNQCIWASGVNISAGCSAAIFTPDWSQVNGSSVLATVSAVNCEKNGIAFVIPEWIRQQYDAINFNINNPYQRWTAPIHLRIR